jgi:TolB-like protein/Tfp pilus assembly protein PilF
MDRLQLKLLGGFESRLASGPVLEIAARKTRALLAYLALPTGRTHTRDKLVGLLWSDRADEQARNSLRQALTEIGKALKAVEPAPLVKGQDTLMLDPASVTVDVLELEQLAASNVVSDLRLAAALYTGDLLDGLDTRDAGFEDWLRVERQRLRTLAATVLKKLLVQENGPSAIAVAQRLVALDPLQEEGHRALMRLHAEAGEIGDSLRQYEICRDTLKRELDVAPSPETEALCRLIRDQSNNRTPLGSAPRPPAAANNTMAIRNGEEISKPSVAVLPFRNLSDNSTQQYFSDGVTEDIITELSRFQSLTVIARHSSFAFRDRSYDIVEVAQKLGVQCIVEGSVRRGGERMRVTARLLDAQSGSQLWSEHYDREAAEVFEVQDQIVQAIVTALSRRIDVAGMRQARRKRPENLTAYDYFLRGCEHYLTMDRMQEPAARHWFEKALALDPNLAIAYAWMAGLHLRDWNLDLSPNALERALALAKRSVSLDPNHSQCQATLGVLRLYLKEFDEAALRFERALTLNPNDTDVFVFIAWLAAYRGQPREGLDWIDKASRLNPYPPPWFDSSKGMVLFGLRRYAESVACFKRSVELDTWERLYLVAACGQLGWLQEAEAHNVVFLTVHPQMSLHQFAAIEPYENPADLEHLVEGLRKAGLPD